jgi:phage pi2 protein 07
MEDKIITFSAAGDYPFSFNIEKAIPSEVEGKQIISGIASTMTIDHDNERMSKQALESMVTVINEKGVPLRIEHNKADSAIVGKVYEAVLDERNQLCIKAEIDKTHPAGPILYQSLKSGAKLGFSVGGKVKKAVKEFSEKTGRLVKTFYDVFLDEVSITQRPANYDSWCFAKSITKKGENADSYRDTDHYREFLFENRSLDYMQAFAKSIPEQAWHKVEQPIINSSDKSIIKNMDSKDTKETAVKAEETETTETAAKAEDTKETNEKAEDTKEEFVSAKSFESFKSMVGMGIASLTSLVEKMVKAEATDETKPAEKAEETKEKAEETETAEKAEETETKEKAEACTETAEKADATETKEVEKEDEKKESETDNGGEYAIKSAIEKMQRMSKAMDSTETKEKAEETETKEKAEETVEETKKSQGSNLDALVFAMAEAIEKIGNNLKSSGKSVVGFEKHIVDSIKTNPELQETLKDMLKEPGFKKSVSLGNVYMSTKDGKRYSLIANDVNEKVEKSAKPATFKELYNTGYSSTSEGGIE